MPTTKDWPSGSAPCWPSMSTFSERQKFGCIAFMVGDRMAAGEQLMR